MKQFETEKLQKLQPKYVCTMCDYFTCNKYNFEKHVATDKHRKCKIETDLKQNETDLKQEVAKVAEMLQCHCGASFHSRTSLWRHKRGCDSVSESCNFSMQVKSKELSDKDLILMLINDNKELRNILFEQAREKDEYKTMMLEVIKNGTNNTTSTNMNTNTNCMNNNKTFNLQFFLNETCKDAMNITDFVDSIKVQLSDLERFGEVDYVEGLSSIISSNLKALDVTERPVHCTDKKRETIYIKDQDKWEKEDDNRTKLRKAIKKIASKNYRLLPAYREKYPGCQYADSKYSDKYNKMVVEAMGGGGDNESEKEDKIIRNISKSIVIDK
jgi:hypothetical protein